MSLAKHGEPSLPVVLVPLTRRQKLAASAFALWFVGSATLMAVPWPQVRPRIQQVMKPTLPLLFNLGIHHRLQLFSPSPPRWTGGIFFRVTYADGGSEFWSYPRSVLSPGDPPGSYNRYLFYYTAWSFPQTGRILQPYLARFIARSVNRGTRQPSRVEFVERLARIPAPEQGMGQPPPALTEEIVILRYDVATDKAQVTGRPRVW